MHQCRCKKENEKNKTQQNQKKRACWSKMFGHGDENQTIFSHRLKLSSVMYNVMAYGQPEQFDLLQKNYVC